MCHGNNAVTPDVQEFQQAHSPPAAHTCYKAHVVAKLLGLSPLAHSSSAFTRIDEATGETGDADGPPEPGPSTLKPHGLPFQEGVGETDFGVTVHK